MVHSDALGVTARRRGGWLIAAAALAVWFVPSAVQAADEDLFCSTGAAVFGESKVVMSGPSRVNGADVRVGSNNLISLSGSSVIEGSAVSGGDVKMSGSAAVLGAVQEDAPPEMLQNVDALVAAHAMHHQNQLVGLTDGGEQAMKGLELVVSGGDAITLPGGDYYLEKLVLSGGSTLRLAGDVRVYLTGKVDLSGGSLAAQSGFASSLLVVGAGKSEVKLSGASNFHGGVYLPGGKFEISGDGNGYGAFAAREVKLSGGSEIHGHDICAGGLPDFEPPAQDPVDDQPHYEPAPEDYLDGDLIILR